MKNEIQFSDIVTTILALSALRQFVDNPALPGPLGRNDEAALTELVGAKFTSLCADLGYCAEGNSVDLPADCHDLIAAVVTDRVVAQLTGGAAPEARFNLLRSRLRRVPSGPRARY